MTFSDASALNNLNMHIHTTFSDGVLTPKSVIEAAKQNNLDIISLTDHDTIEAYKHIPSSHIPLRLLPGIELSSSWQESDVHVLGYGIDIKNKNLLDVLSWMKDGRHNRAKKILDNLSILGIKMPIAKVLAYAGEKKLIVRPHIAKALVAEKHCKNKQEAFEKFIGNDAPAYVAKPMFTTKEVIQFIHEAGGVAVIAHPGKLNSLSYLRDFVEMGIDGLEVWHPDHDLSLRLELEEFCAKHGLYQTGGSDFHGEDDSSTYINSIPISEAMMSHVKEIWDDYKWRMK